MANSMQINIQATGVMSAVAGMQKLLGQAQAIQRYQPAGGGNGGGGGNALAGGPAQRLLKAQANLQKALQSGSGAAIFDAQVGVKRAQDAAKKAEQFLNPKGAPFWQRLGSFISSSRIGMGGGGLQFMPLVGRMLSLFGASGPIGLAVTAGAAVISAFVMAVHHAAEALNELRNAALVSGGSNGDLSALTAMGMSPGAAAQAAQQFSASSASNGFVAMMRAQAGIGQNVGGPMGELNKAAPLATMLRYIASFDTLEERQRAAMMADQTAMMPLIEAYHKHAAAIDQDAKYMAFVNDDKATTAAADFMFQLSRIGEMLQLIAQAVFGEYLQDWADGLGVIADNMRDLAGGVKVLAPLLRPMVDVLIAPIGALDTFLTMLGKLDKLLNNVNGGFEFLTSLRGSLFGKIYDGFAALMNALVPLIFKGLDAIVNAWVDSLATMYNALRSIPLFKSLPALGAMPHLDLSNIDFKLPSWNDITDPMADLAGAVRANTAATDANTGVFKPGTYGGGAAVRGAVPSKWTKFDAQNQVAIWNAQRLGAFAMG